jgi:uncharacterized protein YmfQ (DUF2313 family)
MTTVDRHVRRSGNDYAEAWSNLLPTGLAWPREASSLLMRIVRGLGQVWGNWVDRRIADLLEQETDPRLTLELLAEWERAWGLPDNCFLGVGQTISGRRRFLMLKMTLKGGQSRAWFIWVSAQLGHDISITEFAPFMCGISRVGDTRVVDASQNLFVGDLT